MMRFPFNYLCRNMIKNLTFDWFGVDCRTMRRQSVGSKALGLQCGILLLGRLQWQSIFGEVESGKLSADEFLSAFSRLWPSCLPLLGWLAPGGDSSAICSQAYCGLSTHGTTIMTYTSLPIITLS